MKQLSLALALLSGFSASEEAFCLNRVETHDAVEAFLQATVERPADEWEALFEKLEAAYPEFYANIAFAKEREGWQERRQKQLRHFFSTLPSTRSQMMKLNDEQEMITRVAEEGFKRLLPGSKLDVDVYFLPGLTFNGRADRLTPDATSQSMYIALDRVAEWNNNVPVLMAHELFHIHHFEQATDKGNTLTSALWTEGLATFASGEIASTDDTNALLMDANLATACNNAETVRLWAKEFRQVAEVSDNDANVDKLYADWFLLSGGGEYQRRGYCLGLVLARTFAANGSSLSEMTSWDYPIFRQKIIEALDTYQ